MPDTPKPDILKQANPKIRGRGAPVNPAGRFEKFTFEHDPEALNSEAEDAPDGKQIRTEFLIDSSRTIVSTNDSPDIGMEATVNPYRGCEHGCIYCFARPTHEYLGLSAGLDFESRIFIKPKAEELLKEKLAAPSWEPKVVVLSGVTDCYQPVEKRLGITRRCFEVLRDFRNPASIITKNQLVTRDIDIFREMAAMNLISINMSVTTLDPSLARTMEPRASQPALRLKAIEQLAAAGVPVRVMMGPVVPGLTDHEIPQLLKACADAGAVSANYTMLRLPYGVKDLFVAWLEEHYPDKKDRVLNRVRSMRDGKLNDAHFGTRMRGKGIFAEQVGQMFWLSCRKYGLDRHIPPLSTKHFRRDAHAAQLSLF